MPAEPWSGYRRFCPLARSLDVIGERWTLVIVHELLSGARRYGELQTRLPGIGTSVLADRLRKLEGAGVVARRPGEQGAVVLYELTEAGRELGPAMAALRSWGVRYLYQPVTDADGGVECFDLVTRDFVLRKIDSSHCALTQNSSQCIITQLCPYKWIVGFSHE